MSSSILRPADHLKAHPDILFDSIIELESCTIDQLDLGTFDALVVDVQGAEKLVLQGGLKKIACMVFCFIEVSAAEHYQDNTTILEIVELLADNFELVDLRLNRYYYGDAFFINKRFIKI
jgi:hypothetical protein